MKRNVALNEMIRINRNCSNDVPWEELAKHFSYYISRLQYSGYPEEFRQHVLSDTLMYINRPVSSHYYNRPARPTDRQQWYLKGGQFNSVMFVDATPCSELAKRIRSAVVETGLRIKVVEKSGTTVKSLLQRSNPFGVDHCGRADCFICEGGNEMNGRIQI